MSEEVENIKVLRAQKEIYRNEIKGLTDKITQMLDAFNSDVGAYLISYKDLNLLEFNVPYHVNEKVKFTRVKAKQPNMVCFIAELQKGGGFGRQMHDVQKECRVIKGNLIESLQGDITYHIDTTISYDAFQLHKPYTNEDSVYHIEFKIDQVNLTSAT